MLCVIVNRKAAEYNLFWIGNGLAQEGILLVEQWIDKVFDKSTTSYR